MMKGATTAWHGQSTKTIKKRISCDFQTWDFERRSGDSTVETIGATQRAHGQSAGTVKIQTFFEIGVTAAPHPVIDTCDENENLMVCVISRTSVSMAKVMVVLSVRCSGF